MTPIDGPSRPPTTQQYRDMIRETRPGMLRLGIVFFAAVTVMIAVMVFVEPTLEKRLRAAKAAGGCALFTLMFYGMLISKRS